jgi:hypothetical protein
MSEYRGNAARAPGRAAVVVESPRIVFKVGSYDTYLWYWRSLTPQVITFDPEGVRA